MAGRTTTTRTPSCSSAPSADLTVAPFTFEDLAQAYFDCRRHKRNTNSARRFELNLEENLLDLHDELPAFQVKPAGKGFFHIVDTASGKVCGFRRGHQQALDRAEVLTIRKRDDLGTEG